MESQRALLEDYSGSRLEFQCDVTKACHHGSDKVSYEFLSTLRPAVTVISSGDSESHDHPRPSIVAASATTGYLEISEDSLVTPLVYCTELVRSLQLGKPTKITFSEGENRVVVDKDNLCTVTVSSEVTKVGELKPSTKEQKLGNTLVVAGMVYGLVNVRTDGEKILCASLSEKNNEWQVRTLKSRF